jgi:hypothetical protein
MKLGVLRLRIEDTPEVTGLSRCLSCTMLGPGPHAEVDFGTQGWYLHENTLLRQGFEGLSAIGEIRRSNEFKHMQGSR